MIAFYFLSKKIVHIQDDINAILSSRGNFKNKSIKVKEMEEEIIMCIFVDKPPSIMYLATDLEEYSLL